MVKFKTVYQYITRLGIYNSQIFYYDQVLKMQNTISKLGLTSVTYVSLGKLIEVQKTSPS